MQCVPPDRDWNMETLQPYKPQILKKPQNPPLQKLTQAAHSIAEVWNQASTRLFDLGWLGGTAHAMQQEGADR